MQDAGGERQALLPAARELPGELAAPVGEPHPVDDSPTASRRFGIS